MSKSSIKKIIFYTFAPFVEIMALPFLVLLALYVRFFHSVPDKRLFMGMMHTNNWVYVARAMRERGYDTIFMTWMIPAHEVDVIAYDVNLQRLYPRLHRTFIGLYLMAYGVYVWSILRFKVFLLPFQTRIMDRLVLLRWLEVPLLQLAGKIVILNTYGGDVATPRLTHGTNLKFSLSEGYAKDPYYSTYNERMIALNTRVLERQADSIISAIDHVDYMKRVDEYFHLRCIDTTQLQSHPDVHNEPPVLIHAPNHRNLKGTAEIIAAVENLNRRGMPCTLKIIENTSNAELMRIIAKADAVVDQLILGAYARLAIEAMTLGKPVLCYLREDLYPFNPIWAHCPIINVNPDTIEQKLEAFLKSSKEDREALGRRGREFVETYHSMDYVGGRFDAIIQDLLAQRK